MHAPTGLWVYAATKNFCRSLANGFGDKKLSSIPKMVTFDNMDGKLPAKKRRSRLGCLTCM